MTNEEAIEVLAQDLPCEIDEDLSEAMTMAIKALEQQPCEDAISRQAVNDLVDELARAISDERCYISRGRSTATIMQDILDLPPATPKEKTGYWKYVQNDNNPYIGKLYCSECNRIASFEYIFCPNCGARMVSK